MKMLVRKSDKGFTLVEVMTAVLILSVGMLGTAAMLLTSMKSDNYNAHVRGAEYLANQKIEELRGRSADGSLTAEDSKDLTGVIKSSTIYTFSWKVGAYDPTTSDWKVGTIPANAPKMRQVDVLVGWPKCLPGESGCECVEDQVDKCKNRLRTIGFIMQP
jgi:prepilin-type N-terminal cleavage/methylation domain-containing protein